MTAGGGRLAKEESFDGSTLLEAVLAAMEDAVIVVRPLDGVILMANPAGGRVFGAPPEVLVGESSRGLHENDRAYADFGERLATSLDAGRPYRTEHTFRRTDGTPFRATVTVTPLDPAEWTRGVVSVFRDIGELRGLVETAAILSDHERPLEEALQRVVDVLPTLWPARRAVARIEFDGIARATEGFRETERMRRVRFSGLTDETGVLTVGYAEEPGDPEAGAPLVEDEHLLSALAFQLEAHCRSRGRRAVLERDRDRFLELFRTGPVAMALSRAHDGVFVEVNDRWVEYTGYHRDELIGRSAVDLDLWDGLSQHGRLREQLKQLGVVDGLRIRYRPRSGEPREAFGSIRVVELAGTSLWFTTLHDTTERWRFEEERTLLEEQRTTLERLGAIGELAGGVAHDFNNLLLPILVNTELALDEAVGDLRTRFEEIREAALRGREITKKLLAFGRRQAVQARPLDVNAVVESAQPLMRRLVPGSIQIDVSLDGDARPVRADPTHLEQVLMNLVVNARDAIEGAGRIEIRTYTREAEDRDGRLDASVPLGAYTYLEVGDDGPGIPPDVVKRMFEPFFSTKAALSGTGLGLATVHGMVQQHAGHILLDTKRGIGTTFRVGFPCVEATSEAKQEAHRAAPRGELTPSVGEGRSILVVEDDDAVRRVTVRALKAFGFSVLQTSHPEQALDVLAAADDVDLVLSDIVMPGMTGLDLRDVIHERAPALPVLFVSGYSAAVLTQRGIDRASLRILGKPFSPDGLVRAVLDTIDAAESA